MINQRAKELHDLSPCSAEALWRAWPQKAGKPPAAITLHDFVFLIFKKDPMSIRQGFERIRPYMPEEFKEQYQKALDRSRHLPIDTDSQRHMDENAMTFKYAYDDLYDLATDWGWMPDTKKPSGDKKRNTLVKIIGDLDDALAVPTPENYTSDNTEEILYAAIRERTVTLSQAATALRKSDGTPNTSGMASYLISHGVTDLKDRTLQEHLSKSLK